MERSYEELIQIAATRKGAAELEHYLWYETCWADAPASTRYHMNVPGGLVTHSVNVVNTLLALQPVLAPGISPESCVIVGLYHDAGKIGVPGAPYYLPQTSQWHRDKLGQNYIVNDALTHIDIATRSLMIVSRFVDLTDEEAQAIRYHDGQYVNDNKSVAHKELPLTRLIQFADSWSAGVLEAKTS